MVLNAADVGRLMDMGFRREDAVAALAAHVRLFHRESCRPESVTVPAIRLGGPGNAPSN